MILHIKTYHIQEGKERAHAMKLEKAEHVTLETSYQSPDYLSH